MDFEEHLQGIGPIVFAFASENDFRFEWGNFLSEIQIPHVLFRDSRNDWHNNGVVGIGDVRAVVDYMQGYHRSITIGLSKGGYAALKYGKLASASKVIAISPVTGMHKRQVIPIDDLKILYSDGPNPDVCMFVSDGHGTDLDLEMAARINVGITSFYPGYNHGGRDNLAHALRVNGVLKAEIFR